MTITAEDMAKRLEKLSRTKSPGPVKMHLRVLRELRKVLADPLANLFKLSMDTGILPMEWKLGNVSPIHIHKKGSRQIPGNYRSVSLTSVVGKVMEQLIKNIIDNHLLANDLRV